MCWEKVGKVSCFYVSSLIKCLLAVISLLCFGAANMGGYLILTYTYCNHSLTAASQWVKTGEKQTDQHPFTHLMVPLLLPCFFLFVSFSRSPFFPFQYVSKWFIVSVTIHEIKYQCERWSASFGAIYDLLASIVSKGVGQKSVASQMIDFSKLLCKMFLFWKLNERGLI